MKKYYEFKMYAESGEYFSFEDDYENVVIRAESPEEAETKLLELVSAEYEEEAKKYVAHEIEDMNEYDEENDYTIWK